VVPACSGCLFHPDRGVRESALLRAWASARVYWRFLRISRRHAPGSALRQPAHERPDSRHVASVGRLARSASGSDPRSTCGATTRGISLESEYYESLEFPMYVKELRFSSARRRAALSAVRDPPSKKIMSWEARAIVARRGSRQGGVHERRVRSLASGPRRRTDGGRRPLCRRARRGRERRRFRPPAQRSRPARAIRSRAGATCSRASSASTAVVVFEQGHAP